MRDILVGLGIIGFTTTASPLLSREEGHVWTTPQDSVNGSFIFPRAYPLTFREGSKVNISWSTAYDNINLYFYQRGKVANSKQLVTNLATEWYQWEARADETNLTNPFVFRIVNAQGSAEEQSGGGFWSTSWYLTRDDDPGTSAVGSSAAATSTTVASPMATLSSTTSTSVTDASSTTQVMETEATLAPSTAGEAHNRGMNTSTVIGLTVGLVAAGAAVIAGLLYCFIKRQRSQRALSSTPRAVSYFDTTHNKKSVEQYTVHEVFAQPTELQSVSPCYELPSQKIV